MPAVAFMPWVRIDEPIKVLNLRLLPYEQGKLPGDSPHLPQTKLDSVMRRYVRGGQPIRKATLVELGGYQRGGDVRRYLDRIRNAHNKVKFAGLTNRLLFRNSDYLNSHDLDLIVQGIDPNTDNVAIPSRRRDGGTLTLWASTSPAFSAPFHVGANVALKLDELLFRTLLKHIAPDDVLSEAIIEFNAANTDSPDIPSHVELVMLKSAFDWLLGVYRNRDFVSRLATLIGQSSPPIAGPLSTRWAAKYRGAGRPLKAWADEFCQFRNVSAHGGDRRGDRFVWSLESHLAFASMLFPLAVKKQLSDQGRYELSDDDADRLLMIDRYVVVDPMRRVKWPRPHPWVQLEDDELFHNRLTRTLAEALS